MAINAKFVADFSNFTAAVQHAEVSLKGFESGAGKVEKSLNKMAEGFSGTKLIQDATLAAAAVERIGGVSKLTESEQIKLNRAIAEALAKYRALGQEAPPHLKALADATSQVHAPTSLLHKTFGDLGTQIKATALGFVSAQAIIGGVKMAFGTMTEFVGSSIASFAAAEAAQKKMTTALASAGRATPEVIGQMNNLADQFQKTTVYSDDLTNEMQALLIQVGNVMPSEMAKAQTAAADLASGLGIDLRAATMLVGKAFEGETGTLKRYGIVIDETKLKAEGMPAVLDAIQSRFGGQAAAELGTYAGQIKQMANEWDNFKESVGKAVVQNPFVVAGLRNMTTGVQDLNAEAVKGQTSWKEWGGAFSWAIDRITSRQESINRIVETMRTINAETAKNTPALKTGAPMAAPTGIDITQYLKDAEKANIALKKAQDAGIALAKAYAEAAKALVASMTGNDKIKAAELAVIGVNTALSQGVPIIKMTREQQDALQKTMGEVLSVYKAQGIVAPKAFRDIYAATGYFQSGIPIIKGFGDALKDVGVQAKIAAPPMRDVISGIGDLQGKLPRIDNSHFLGRMAEDFQRIAEAEKRARAALDELAGSFQQLAQIGGASFGTLLQGIGALIAGLNAAQKAAALYGGRDAGIASALFAGKGSSAEEKWAAGVASAGAIASGALSVWNSTAGSANDAMKTLKGAMGGAQAGAVFGPWGAAIGAAAGALTGFLRGALGVTEYEKRVRGAASETTRLQQALLSTHGGMTQLVADAARVGINITEAFRWQDPEALALVIADLEQKTKALGITAGQTGDKQTAATQQAMDAIGALDDRIKSLSDSIAGEAPEEFMGVIEAQTRAQIAAIQKERDAAQTALNETIVSAADAAEVAGNIIDKALAERLFVIRVKAEIDGLPGGTASGTGLYAPPRGGGGSGAGGDTVVQSNLYMDSLKVAEALVTLQKRVGG